MAQVNTEPLANWEPREDISVERNLYQPNGLLSTFATTETIEPQQQAPFASIKGESISENYTTASPTWNPSSLTVGHLSTGDSPAITSDSELCGHLPKDLATVPYSMSGQSMTLKSSVVGGGPLGIDYSADSMLFNSPMTMSASLSAAVSTPALVPTAPPSYFAFGSTTSTTPMAMHLSTHSSPASQHIDLLNNANISPFDRIPSTAISSVDCAPSFASAMSTPAPSRLQFAIPTRNYSGRTDLASELKIVTKPPMMHSKSAIFATHGPGMANSSNSDSRFSSSDQSGHGLATQPPLSAGSRPDNALFPSLLHRICMDPNMNDVAYWDEDNHVCIPVIENLRVQLNIMGMTANHTDSLQKNFNDYQFNRRTDQRRVRHTTEVAIVKFYNPNFLPDREDLLHLVVRKSALKKLQNTANQRDRPSTSSSSRKKARVPSVRTNGQRGVRQSVSERSNPYSRHGSGESNHMSAFQLPVSPMSHFPPHSAPSPTNQLQPMYHNGEPSTMMMPLGVHSVGFGIGQPASAGDRPESALISPTTSGSYAQQPFYMGHAPPAFGFHGGMAQPHTSLTPIQSQYTPAFPSGHSYPRHPSLQASPQYQPQPALHNEYSDGYNTTSYHQLAQHGQQQQHPAHIPQQQYHLFANSNDLSSEYSPPRVLNSGNYPM
ncbi:hypothetical protein GGH94_003874 [Coemansia aciculifera]|uniref:HSF-type DNA-binding domain-containing protein n=1 Tax=Coemansia aciculifera TaxID=417176 RepID=A0A9W8M2R2_9FUNG|nr:hypothetical protein GGH94_003874 [Coemansia aciculifera]